MRKAIAIAVVLGAASMAPSFLSAEENLGSLLHTDLLSPTNVCFSVPEFEWWYDPNSGVSSADQRFAHLQGYFQAEQCDLSHVPGWDGDCSGEQYVLNDSSGGTIRRETSWGSRCNSMTVQQDTNLLESDVAEPGCDAGETREYSMFGGTFDEPLDMAYVTCFDGCEYIAIELLDIFAWKSDPVGSFRSEFVGESTGDQCTSGTEEQGAHRDDAPEQDPQGDDYCDMEGGSDGFSFCDASHPDHPDYEGFEPVDGEEYCDEQGGHDGVSFCTSHDPNHPENPDYEGPGDDDNGDGDNGGDGETGDGEETQPGESEESAGSASGGQTCGTPPSCSGDPILCHTLRQNWETRCEVQQQRELWETALDPDQQADIDQGIADAEGALSEGVDEVEVGFGDLDTSGFGLPRTCPVPDQMQVLGESYDLPPAMCNVLSGIGYVVLGLAIFISIRILGGD